MQFAILKRLIKRIGKLRKKKAKERDRFKKRIILDEVK
jgi:hypothetical protein